MILCLLTRRLIRAARRFAILWGYRSIPECHKGGRAVTFWYNYAYVGVLIVLFTNFFVQSYLVKKEKKRQ